MSPEPRTGIEQLHDELRIIAERLVRVETLIENNWKRIDDIITDHESRIRIVEALVSDHNRVTFSSLIRYAAAAALLLALFEAARVLLAQ